MKASELAAKLMEHPDFEVKFHWFDSENATVLSFENIDVCDIGHSDQVIVLSGDED